MNVILLLAITGDQHRQDIINGIQVFFGVCKSDQLNHLIQLLIVIHLVASLFQAALWSAYINLFKAAYSHLEANIFYLHV